MKKNTVKEILAITESREDTVEDLSKTSNTIFRLTGVLNTEENSQTPSSIYKFRTRLSKNRSFHALSIPIRKKITKSTVVLPVKKKVLQSTTTWENFIKSKL